MNRPLISRHLKACSSAVKTDVVQIVFSVIALIVAAACQDAVSTLGGAKVPVLLVFPLYTALTAVPRVGASGAADRTGRFADGRWLWTAAAAGWMLDALGGLPFGCCTGFLTALCAGGRMVRPFITDAPRAVVGLCAGAAAGLLHEIWLHAWGVSGEGPLLIRVFAGVCLGAAAGGCLFAVLPGLERRIGLREETV